MKFKCNLLSDVMGMNSIVDVTLSSWDRGTRVICNDNIKNFRSKDKHAFS